MLLLLLLLVVAVCVGTEVSEGRVARWVSLPPATLWLPLLASLASLVLSPVPPHRTAPQETAAVIIEPVMGEGGFLTPPPGFLSALRTLCDKHGMLLIFDEARDMDGCCLQHAEGCNVAASAFLLFWQVVFPDAFIAQDSP